MYNNVIKTINIEIKNFMIIWCNNYGNSVDNKLLCSFNTFYIGKINSNFKIRYKYHSLKIKFKKTNSESNFTKNV